MINKIKQFFKQELKFIDWQKLITHASISTNKMSKVCHDLRFISLNIGANIEEAKINNYDLTSHQVKLDYSNGAAVRY